MVQKICFESVVNMNTAKRKRLEDAGFRVGSAAEFLGLSIEESELIEIKLTLTRTLKKHRRNSRLSQSQLASHLGSSQSRIAKMEAGDPHVSLDLMLRALLALGVTRTELANVIAPQPSQPSVVSIGQVSLSRPEIGKMHYKFKTCASHSTWDADSISKFLPDVQVA